MGDWDNSLKAFVSENPQDFVTWLLKGGQFKRKLATEFKIRTIEADNVLEVSIEERDLLVEIEFQTTYDPEMAERMLRYHVQAYAEHRLPVYSCVIYLKDVGEVPQPPLRRRLPNGREVLWFDYESIELAKVPVEELEHTGLVGVLPLLILTKGGGTYEVLDKVITRLEAVEQRALLPITELLAGLVFTSPEDQERITRRFTMLKELRDTWTYKAMTKEAREEGKIEGLRQAVVDVVQERFPEIAAFAQKQVDLIEDAALLRRLIAKMSSTQTVQEAVQMLITVDRDEKKNDEGP